MNYIQQLTRRTTLLGLALSLFAIWAVADFTVFTNRVAAAQVTQRKLSLSSSANGSITTGNPGSGSNGQKAQHTVTFTLGTTAATVGSVALIYCTNPIPQTSCTSSTAATGNAANLTSATVSGLAGSGWALDTTTSNPTISNYGTCNGATGTTRDNCVLVKATSAAANAGTPTVTITYGGGASNYITNPTNDNTTFYVRIVVFSNTTYGTVVDSGGIANSTAQQIDITAKVQETLNFSVGSTVTAPGSSCTAFSDTGALNLGDSNGVLSFTQAYDAHSYFRVSTNAGNGTIVYFSGDTLKSGANTITGLSNASTASASGTQQFGLAIDSSDGQSGSGYSFTSLTADTPYDGGAGTLTNGTGTARFAFDTASVTTPRQIAHSTGTIVCDTGSIRYLGNISTTTPPGIYTTTITYLATPTY